MDRIDASLINRLTLTRPTQPPVGPRAIDPTARLRFVDRQDSVELRSVPSAPDTDGPSPSAAAAPARARLLAGTVSEPAQPGDTAKPATLSPAAGRALKLYQNPSDQNAAATRGAAGTLIDLHA